MVEAFAYGGGSVLNAIATWKGAAFAINLRVKAYAVKSDEMSYPNALAREVINEVSKVCELGNVRVWTESEIPAGGGLKSSSAAANAMTLALLKLCGLSPSPYMVLKMSVAASKRAGVTVTGAFDDASASLLGGLVVTDNRNMIILKRIMLKGLKAVVLPKGGRGMSFEEVSRRLKAFKKEFGKVFKMIEEDPFEAMTFNGLLVAAALNYSAKPIQKAIESGALASAVSGNGPSYVSLVEPDKVEDVLEALSEFGKPIVADLPTQPAYLPN
ncbi:shikimate kinase [Ignicoccus pacificus DSM 13166]|uniref:Shikimate kinase n=1 Tax=Ignicoccus pacificus DSM 13166 TaxID=940294 RepID=A0A977K8V0_9CREN|nr:shikimate kinase [Ignicoccus pacificus DSM 13166]